MKLFTFSLFACLISMSAPADTRLAGDVFIGDNYADVIAVMGEPSVSIKMEKETWLKYERGTVKFEGDRVIEARLISLEEANARRQKEQLQYEQYTKRMEEQRIRRIEEGYALKAARMADPYFQDLSSERQVAFWRQFQAKYPEVPSQNEYRSALSRFESEQQVLTEQRNQYEREQRELAEKREQEARILELEERVARAELRAQRRVVRCVQQPQVVYVPQTYCYTPRVPRVEYRTTYPKPYISGTVFTTSGSGFSYGNRHSGQSLAANVSF